MLDREREWNVIQQWNTMSDDDRLEMFSCDLFGHRLHSVFSYFPSELRAYVDLNGKNVDWCLDLKTSQFTLAADIVKKAQGPCKFTTIVEYGDNGMDLYEKMGEHLGIKDPKSARKVGKTWCMLAIFGSIKRRYHKKFKSLFPDAGSFFEKIKSEVRDPKKCVVRKTIKPNANLPMDLQRFESKIFSQIWKELYAADVHFLPCHDAIYCSDSDKNAVLIVMNWVLSRFLSVNFTIKHEPITRLPQNIVVPIVPPVIVNIQQGQPTLCMLVA